jgi:hypothetical protein
LELKAFSGSGVVFRLFRKIQGGGDVGMVAMVVVSAAGRRGAYNNHCPFALLLRSAAAQLHPSERRTLPLAHHHHTSDICGTCSTNLYITDYLQ